MPNRKPFYLLTCKSCNAADLKLEKNDGNKTGHLKNSTQFKFTKYNCKSDDDMIMNKKLLDNNLES
jgi:hypothetical protein